MTGLRHFSRRQLLHSLRRRRLLVELLEDRRLLSVFTVDSAGDEPDWLPGDGKALTINKTTTLRAAIMEANASVGKDTIEFNISGAGPHVIKPATRLPAIIDPISIDGYSQPGASATSLTLHQGNNAIIKIELDGSLLPIGTNGLEIFGGQSEVRGLAIHSFYGRPITHEEFLGTTIVAENGSGIWLWAGGNSQIVGNFLGATASGLVPTYPLSAGTATSGIMVGSYDNVIQENLVVGNHGPGIVLGSKLGDVLATNVRDNKLFGNYIGMQQNGQTPLPNDTGILVCWGAHDNQIGGGSANFGNLISGNSSTGVSIVGVGPGGAYFGGNLIQRNLIGTDKTGKLIDPDKKPKTGDETGNRRAGIQIDSSPDNVIGGTAADAGNVLSGNEVGILIVEPQSENNWTNNNKIGTDVEGKIALPNGINGIDVQNAPRNTIKSNLISGNSGSGIYIEGATATGNVIETNLIGTDTSGTKALGNHFGGIDIIKATGNVVYRNTISGSPSFGIGVTISGAEAKKNRVTENRIGTDVTGQIDLGNTGAGVAIVGGSENLINGNIISGNDLCGVLVDGTTARKNDVYGNYIGTDVSGTLQLKNGLDGIWIQNAPDNWIGGYEPSARNVIAGNDRDGIRITGKTARSNTVSGNYIGTDSSGMKPLANGEAGVRIDNAPENMIGGTTSNRRNIISSNLSGGVIVVGVDAVKNVIQSNYIGTNKDGTGTDLGNPGDGILIDKAAETVIGGATTQAGSAPGNVIAGNWLYGVQIKGKESHSNKVQGNSIGRNQGGNVLANLLGGVLIDNAPTNIIGEKPDPVSGQLPDTGAGNVISGNGGDAVRVRGNEAIGNVIRRNSIYENQGLGVNLVGFEHLRVVQDGVTPNDPLDGDTGPNDLMNFPVGVTSYFNGVDTYISGVLDTRNPDSAQVDVYANQKVGATGFGEGQMYVGTATPDRQGNFVLKVSGALLPEYRFLSATATSGQGRLSTSEFSPVYRGYGAQNSIDTDGDHLPDEWEIEGVDFDGDGRPDLDLGSAQYGADPNRKDIFVEVDYMEDATRSYRPEPGFEWLVQQAFLSAPVDGAKGIAIHIDVDEAVPLILNLVWKRGAAAGTGALDDYDDIKLGNPENPTGTGVHDAHFGTVDERDMRDPSTGSDDIARNILGAKRLVYRYCIFGNYFLRTKADGTTEPTKSGGVSEPFGNDFIVTLGPRSAKVPGSNAITDWLAYQASTFMHELGHTMGLGHGGPWPRTSWDAWASDVESNLNYKPNFLSIMNYAFSFPDPVPDRPMDFSRWTLPFLEEAQLIELKGLNPPNDLPKLWRHTTYTIEDTGKKLYVERTKGAIDWDRDGLDLNEYVQAGINDYNDYDDPNFVVTKDDVLMGAEEWSQLFFHFRASPRFVESAHGDELPTPDPSREDAEEMARYVDFDRDGLMTPEDNAPALFNPDQTDSDGDGVGDAGELAGFTISRGAAVGGDTLVGTVTLLVPAPAGGTFVRLYGSDMAVATVPREVEIPEGARSATFAVATSRATREITPVTILADFFQQYLTAEFTVTPAPADADLSLAMTAVPDPVGLGGAVTYTIDVTNEGPERATGVTLTDVLPDGAALKSATGTVSDQVPGPGLRVRFDYTYDTGNFFDTPEKKDLLQLAGDILTSAMGDDLATIVPEGSNTWTAIFENPATGIEERIADLVVPANEIIVYVGARDLGDSGTGVQEGALAGPGSLVAAGSADFHRVVTTRGQRGADGPAPTDFGPWGGAITFNTNSAVAFSYDDEVEADAFDFFTVALHEMMHVLGLGTSASWQTYVDAAHDVFTGPAARLEYDAGGDVPLDPSSLAHWREGITEAGEPVLMDPLVPNALRIWYPTALDWAGLADVGWNINGLLTVERPVKFTEMAGSVIADVGVLEPGQSVTITLEVQPTLAGTIHNAATVTGYCDDPDPSNNTAETFGTVTPLVLIVNTTDDVDDGVVDATHTSLREAINAANTALGVNTISFNIPGLGPHTIQPISPLPVITDPVIIDGTTEPDYADRPVIELSGALAGTGGSGLVITVGGSTVRALAINSFPWDPAVLESGNGIVLRGGDGNLIEGCYIGVDATGSIPLGNGGAGILVFESTANVIGGTTAQARNIISGNAREGIMLGLRANNNVVLGNYIGVDAAGTNPLGNGLGGVVITASKNVVGGSDPLARNVISGNTSGAGVRIRGKWAPGSINAEANRVEGNYIGTDATGTFSVANGIGVSVVDADRNVVGGTVPGAGNLISGNLGVGIEVVGIGYTFILLPPSLADSHRIVGNLVGVAADGSTPLGNGSHGILIDGRGNVVIGGTESGAANTIAFNGGDGIYARSASNWVTRANSIFDNMDLGIDIYGHGVTLNRSANTAAFFFGPNFPELTSAYTGGGSTTVAGTLTTPAFPANGERNTRTIDFYATPFADESGHGEGPIYLGSVEVIPWNLTGIHSFVATLPAEVPPGYLITATASTVMEGEHGGAQTSEFSLPIEPAPDADGDGVWDVVEDDGPNGGDANGDGTRDALQAHVATLPNAVNGQYVVLETVPGGRLRDVRALPNPSPWDAPPGVAFPHGFFSYEQYLGPVTFHLPGIDTAYNFGETNDWPFDHWYRVPESDLDVEADRVVLHELKWITIFGPAVILPGAGTTIIVNATDDTDDRLPDNNHTTLREAINRANFLPGKDAIAFNIPGTGPHTIRATSALPHITDTIVIDGYTQPGARPATEDTPATIMIELVGNPEKPSDGLYLAASYSTIRGLCINRFVSDSHGWLGNQIVIARSGARIEGNYLGTDPSGSISYYEPGYYYVPLRGVVSNSEDNVIGGTSPAARNLISGFAWHGVYVGEYDTFDTGRGTRIMGNYIGTDATGTVALPSNVGVQLHHGSAVDVGGTEPGAGNLISGNIDVGVRIFAWDWYGGESMPEKAAQQDPELANWIQGNLIGTDVTGTLSVGNGTGIEIVEGRVNLIGGTDPAARNVISGNLGDGIRIGFGEGPSLDNLIQGNFIGTDVHGQGMLGNGGDGVRIEWSQDIMVGGEEPGAGNVIAFNGGDGVTVVSGDWEGANAQDNPILANRIYANVGLGIDLGGAGVTPNDPAESGVWQEPVVQAEVLTETPFGLPAVEITLVGAPCAEYYVELVWLDSPSDGWSVFTDDTGTAESVVYDSVFLEKSPLIGATATFLHSLNRPNNFQNFPVLRSVWLASDTTIHGTLDSTPNTMFRIEFFANSEADVSTYGEGQVFLGALEVLTDVNGIADFPWTIPERLPLDHFVTASATDPEGNTSEFSLAVAPTAESWDFGDAPDPTLPTLLASNGARHALGTSLYLGAGVDAEEDGQPTESADGDDTTNEADEDGVQFLRTLVPGQWAAVEIVASVQGRLDAWIDFNADGSWADDEDQVFSRALLLPGPNLLFLEVPATASPDTLVSARFRVSSEGGLSFNGPAVDGEVEDYLVYIATPPTDNQPPIARDDEATTGISVPIAIDVMANDMDPEGQLDRLSVIVTALPASGSVFVDPASGVITYIPSARFVGDDAFSYRVRDVEGLVDTAHVIVHVLPGNHPPVALDDAATTAEGVAVVVDVLANDDDPDGNLDLSSVTIVAPPSHGLLQVDGPSGTLTYTPEADYFGTDRFVYRIADTLGAAARAVVAITVQPVSDSPLALDNLAQTDQDVAVVVDVLANDTDADGDLDPTSVSIVVAPQHGLAEVDPVSGQITYTPATGFIGLDSLLYRVFDATEKSATATVRIDVLPTSDPPQAVADAAETPEDTPVSIDVAANDTDADGDLDPRSVQILVGPLQGTAEVDSATGRIQYTPAADFVGDELLWYEIRDARGQADMGLAHITVTPVNDPPLARDDTATVLRDTPTDLYVLSNDTDVDSAIDRTTLRIEVGPTSGTLAIQTDGSVRYTPRAGFAGTDQFRYTVQDDGGARSNVAVVTITVQAEPTVLVVGRTFEDLDRDGPGLEGPGIAGYLIYLLDGQGSLVASTPTQTDDPATTEDETGWYHFPDLLPGTYVVAQKRVSGWRQSYPVDQGIELAEPPVNSGLYVVTLSRSNDIEVLDFGNYRTGEAGYASIAGHVYVDVDNDGICDPQEMGLPNVPITLEGPVTRTVLTDATGHYRADDLPAGVYTISETQPLLFQDGRDTVGVPCLGSLENDQFVGLELWPDMVAEDYNFGEYGLKTQFIGKQLLLASTPPASVYVANLQVGSGESLLLLQAPKSGTLRAAANSEGEPSALQVYDDHWRPVALALQNGVLRVPVTAGEEYLVYVHAARPAVVHAALDTVPAPVYVYRNTRTASDVNGDGYVSPLDALLLINTLNTSGARPLAGVNLSSTYWDVSGDMYLSPLDALLVINGLNGLTGVAEGESSVHHQLRDRALTEYLDDPAAQSTPALEDVLDLLCQTD